MGFIIRKSILFVIILALTHITVNAQFSHRLDIIAEKTISNQSDKVIFQKNYIDYKRKGEGFSFGMKYNFSKLPMALYLGYEDADFSDYSIKSNINVYNFSNDLEIKSIDLDIHYLFYKRSIIKPYIFVGVNYNMIDYINTGFILSNYRPSEQGYIQVKEIRFNSPQSIQTNLNSYGLKVGAGLNVRITDKFGINGSVRFRYIPQNKTNWIGDRISSYTYSIGVYYRFFKDKNIISL